MRPRASALVLKGNVHRMVDPEISFGSSGASRRIRVSAYVAVAILFMISTAFSEPSNSLLLVLVAVFLGATARLDAAKVLVIAIPWDFIWVGEGVSATISASFFVLPWLLMSKLPEIWGRRRLRNRGNVIFILLWIGSMTTGFLLGLTQHEINQTSFFSSLAKFLTVSMFGLIVSIATLGLLRDPKRIMSILKLWVLVAVVAGTLALLSEVLVLVLGFSNPWEWGGGRHKGGFANPNNFALYQLVSLAFAHLVSWIEKRKFLTLTAVFIAASAIQSGSETLQISILTLSLLGIIFLFPDRRMMAKWSTFLGMVFCLVLAKNLVPLLSQGGGTQGSLATVTDDVRFKLWAEIIPLFADQPFFGQGLGQLPHKNSFNLEAHNIFIGLIIESGVVGFIIFFLIFLPLFGTSSIKLPIAKLVRIYLTGILIFGAGNSFLHSPAVWFFLGFFLAFALNNNHLHKSFTRN